MTQADAIREIDTGSPMQRFARGWHCLGLAEEFADGKPRGIEAFGTKLVVFSDAAGCAKLRSISAELVELPTVDPFVAPILHAIAVQMLAYHTAVLRGTSGSTAVVDWALPGGRGATGTVYLRSTAVAGSAPTWTVVGAAASDVALADVQVDLRIL